MQIVFDKKLQCSVTDYMCGLSICLEAIKSENTISENIHLCRSQMFTFKPLFYFCSRIVGNHTEEKSFTQRTAKVSEELVKVCDHLWSYHRGFFNLWLCSYSRCISTSIAAYALGSLMIAFGVGTHRRTKKSCCTVCSGTHPYHERKRAKNFSKSIITELRKLISSSLTSSEGKKRSL